MRLGPWPSSAWFASGGNPRSDDWASHPIAFPDGPSSSRPYDMDGDGDLDAISTSYDGHRTDWWENLLGIFASGFERGDLLDWTSAVP